MIPVLHGVWAAAGGLVGDFEHIETQTVGAGGVTSLTFSSIAGTYKHLQIRCLSQSTYTSSADLDGFNMRFNSDTGANYAWHFIRGTGSAAGSGSFGASNTLMSLWQQSNSSYSVSAWAGGIVDILDYASTSKYKTVRALGGVDTNGTGTEPGRIYLSSGLWMSTSAVTSVTMQSGGTRGFPQHSTFALYGVK